ncbi:MAG: BamA/TamA family outer membrane protein [Gemmatimonadales bacterium]|jgi:hypothetical protein
MRALARIALATVVLLGPRGTLWAQHPPPRGIQWSALPAVNYDSDNGFGYGVTGGIYRFDGTHVLYEWSVEPTLFATTEGRRELLATVDMPFLLAGAARLTLFAGFEHDCCHPYYGFGNASPYDPALADPIAGVNFYTYTRRRWSLVADMQWRILPGLRVLTGMAAYHNRSAARDPRTAFALDSASVILAAQDFRAASAGPKLGVVYDTRDRERDPHRGVWLELLVWRGLGSVIGSSAFTRLGTTARGYLPLGRHLTLAARALGEHVTGDMPAAMLPDIGSSFRDFPGVGGGTTVRGVLRNRYLGRTRVVGNVELRVRSAVRQVLGQRVRLGAVAFVDAGRVWDERGEDGDGLGLHWGKGTGARLGWGDAFIITLDVAHGSEAGVQLYLGLGHLF